MKLITVTLILTVLVGIMNPIYSAKYMTLEVKILLSDGTPLSNATVVFKYSRVSTKEVVNISDTDGVVRLEVNAEWAGPGHHPVIRVNYGFYGTIYENTYNGLGDIPAEIVLPYTVLYRDIRVVDEYGSSLNVSHELYFSDIFIASSNDENGEVVINGSENDKLLLWSIGDQSFNSKYRLVIETPNGTVDYSLDDVGDTIIVDRYKPVIVFEGFNAVLGRNHVLYLYTNISVTDGLNTNKTRVNTEFTVTSGGVSVKKRGVVVGEQYYLKRDVPYRRLFIKATSFTSYFPENTAEYTVLIHIDIVDPADRERVLEREYTYTPAPLGNGTRYTSGRGGMGGGVHGGFINSSGGNPGGASSGYGSGFSPGINSRVAGYMLQYLSAPLIALLVLVLEIRHRSARGAGAQPPS